MEYPYKYPELYAELARQGIDKKAFSKAIGLTTAGLRYKQSKDNTSDFSGEQSRKAANFLNVPAAKLFGVDV